jgi:hypothetical protein
MKKLSDIWHAFLAAITSPDAVKKERSLAALVVFRILLAAGATTGLAELIAKIASG